MAKKTPYGKHILSASEIGTYVFCPEAWKLSYVQQVKPDPSERAQQGEQLHREWAATVDESIYLTKYVRLILMMVALCILLTVLTARWST